MSTPFCSDEELEQHLRDGWSKQKIAEYYHVTVPSVRRRVYQLGAWKTGKFAQFAQEMVGQSIDAMMALTVIHEIGLENLFRLSERADAQEERQETLQQALRTVVELHQDDDLFDPRMLELIREAAKAKDPIPDSIKQQAETRAQVQLFTEMQRTLYDMESLAAVNEMVRQLLAIPDPRVRAIVKQTVQQVTAGKAMLGLDRYSQAHREVLPAELPPTPDITLPNPERNLDDDRAADD